MGWLKDILDKKRTKRQKDIDAKLQELENRSKNAYFSDAWEFKNDGSKMDEFYKTILTNNLEAKKSSDYETRKNNYMNSSTFLDLNTLTKTTLDAYNSIYNRYKKTKATLFALLHETSTLNNHALYNQIHTLYSQFTLNLDEQYYDLSRFNLAFDTYASYFDKELLIGNETWFTKTLNHNLSKITDTLAYVQNVEFALNGWNISNEKGYDKQLSKNQVFKYANLDNLLTNKTDYDFSFKTNQELKQTKQDLVNLINTNDTLRQGLELNKLIQDTWNTTLKDAKINANKQVKKASANNYDFLALKNNAKQEVYVYDTAILYQTLMLYQDNWKTFMKNNKTWSNFDWFKLETYYNKEQNNFMPIWDFYNEVTINGTNKEGVTLWNNLNTFVQQKIKGVTQTSENWNTQYEANKKLIDTKGQQLEKLKVLNDVNVFQLKANNEANFYALSLVNAKLFNGFLNNTSAFLDESDNEYYYSTKLENKTFSLLKKENIEPFCYYKYHEAKNLWILDTKAMDELFKNSSIDYTLIYPSVYRMDYRVNAKEIDTRIINSLINYNVQNEKEVKTNTLKAYDTFLQHNSTAKNQFLVNNGNALKKLVYEKTSKNNDLKPYFSESEINYYFDWDNINAYLWNLTFNLNEKDAKNQAMLDKVSDLVLDKMQTLVPQLQLLSELKQNTLLNLNEKLQQFTKQDDYETKASITYLKMLLDNYSNQIANLKSSVKLDDTNTFILSQALFNNIGLNHQEWMDAKKEVMAFNNYVTISNRLNLYDKYFQNDLSANFLKTDNVDTTLHYQTYSIELYKDEYNEKKEKITSKVKIKLTKNNKASNNQYDFSFYNEQNENLLTDIHAKNYDLIDIINQINRHYGLTEFKKQDVLNWIRSHLEIFNDIKTYDLKYQNNIAFDKSIFSQEDYSWFKNESIMNKLLNHPLFIKTFFVSLNHSLNSAKNNQNFVFGTTDKFTKPVIIDELNINNQQKTIKIDKVLPQPILINDELSPITITSKNALILYQATDTRINAKTQFNQFKNNLAINSANLPYSLTNALMLQHVWNSIKNYQDKQYATYYDNEIKNHHVNFVFSKDFQEKDTILNQNNPPKNWKLKPNETTLNDSSVHYLPIIETKNNQRIYDEADKVLDVDYLKAINGTNLHDFSFKLYDFLVQQTSKGYIRVYSNKKTSSHASLEMTQTALDKALTIKGQEFVDKILKATTLKQEEIKQVYHLLYQEILTKNPKLTKNNLRKVYNTKAKTKQEIDEIIQAKFQKVNEQINNVLKKYNLAYSVKYTFEPLDETKNDTNTNSEINHFSVNETLKDFSATTNNIQEVNHDVNHTTSSQEQTPNTNTNNSFQAFTTANEPLKANDNNLEDDDKAINDAILKTINHDLNHSTNDTINENINHELNSINELNHATNHATNDATNHATNDNANISNNLDNDIYHFVLNDSAYLSQQHINNKDEIDALNEPLFSNFGEEDWYKYEMELKEKQENDLQIEQSFNDNSINDNTHDLNQTKNETLQQPNTIANENTNQVNNELAHQETNSMVDANQTNSPLNNDEAFAKEIALQTKILKQLEPTKKLDNLNNVPFINNFQAMQEAKKYQTNHVNANTIQPSINHAKSFNHTKVEPKEQPTTQIDVALNNDRTARLTLAEKIKKYKTVPSANGLEFSKGLEDFHIVNLAEVMNEKTHTGGFSYNENNPTASALFYDTNTLYVDNTKESLLKLEQRLQQEEEKRQKMKK